MKKLLALALLLGGAAHAQTTVWSCLTNCSATSNTYNDGAWRPPSPAPAFVATTSGTQTNCATNWWNTPGAVRWRRPADLNPAWCVSRRVGTVESFAPASSFGWPGTTTPPPVNCVMSTWSACSLATGQETRSVVTPASNGGTACPTDLTRPCQNPPPGPTVFLTIDRNPILVGESVNVQWTSTNANTCTSTWTASVPANSNGPIALGPFTFAQNVELMVTCRSFFGEYGAGVNLVVAVPEPRSPICFPESKEDMAHVAWEPLALANWTVKYQAKAVWFCSSPTGPKRQAWVFGLNTVAANARRQLDGVLNWDDVRAQCEAECETLSDGPLKSEIAAFAAQFTVEQLGVVR